MTQNNQDLTKGPLARKILFFSAPLIVSNLLQVLFNVADIAVVGRFAGASALGSVGSTTILVTMFKLSDRCFRRYQCSDCLVSRIR